MQQPWVDFSQLEHYNPGKPTILLDDEGNEWTRFQVDRREVISIQQIPKQIIQAFIAAEDWSFFAHSGISWKGIIRSTLINIYNRRIVQGASTITQQLVKLLFFDSEKSFTRKIKEQFVSLMVEQQFTKEQILETYLNHVYFGAGIYGVEAAAQRFWGKHSYDISVDEAALLAAIVRSPKQYCPLYNPEQALQRRNIILHSMAKLQFIADKEYQQARQKSVTLRAHDPSSRGQHLKESIRIVLEELVGKEKLYTGGLKVQTTVNIRMQEKAETLFNVHLSNLRKTITPDLDGALITVEGKTGAIKTLIGGYDFKQSQFNRALKARRQMGSTFKPLIYAAALLAHKSFTEIAIDEPLTLLDNGKEWSPQNFNHIFEGPMTLARALYRSNNIISIKTLQEIGITPVIELAYLAGLKGPLYPYPSLALGCIDSTLQEVASMINIFAHHGIYAEPHCIVWVKDEWGTKIWKQKEQRRRVLPQIIADQVAKVLMISMDRAKQRNPEKWIACESLGKTGTTNDARTCWFTGATPSFTTAIYIGCDNNKPLGKEVYAVQTAFPLWKEFNKSLIHTKVQFPFSKSLKQQVIDELTGEPVESINNPHAIAILTPDYY